MKNQVPLLKSLFPVLIFFILLNIILGITEFKFVLDPYEFLYYNWEYVRNEVKYLKLQEFTQQFQMYSHVIGILVFGEILVLNGKVILILLWIGFDNMLQINKFSFKIIQFILGLMIFLYSQNIDFAADIYGYSV